MDREQEERRPLLESETVNGVDNVVSQTPRDNRRSLSTSPFTVVLLAIAMIFVFDLSNQMIVAPMMRIYESIICQQYYDSHEPQLYAGKEIPEDECKIPPVQQELALVRGMEPVFDAIPSLIVAIPLGMIADNPAIGRKPVIVVAIVGAVLQIVWTFVVTWFSGIFPLRLVWLGSLFGFVGGTNVINAILYTMLIDVTEPTERASTFFSLQLVGSWIPTLIGPLITSQLMIEVGNWTPAFIGLALSGLGIMVTMVFPETIHFREGTQEQPQSSSSQPNYQTGESPSPPDFYSPGGLKRWLSLQTRLAEFLESSSFVFQSPHLVILVCSSMMHMICLVSAPETVVYYASKRYNMSIAKANLLNTVNAAVCIGVLLLLPFISTGLTRWVGISSQRKDLLIAQVSVTLFAIGWYIVGFASTLGMAVTGLVIYTLGSGFQGAVRSLAASYVEPHHQARLSSFIAIMMTVGNFVGSPLLAGSYSLGVSLGDPFWLGLPFFGLALIFSLIGSALWFVIELPEGEQSTTREVGSCEEP